MLNSGTPAEVEAACRELLDLFRGQGGLMIGPGCALGPNTPGENIRTLVETTKKFG